MPSPPLKSAPGQEQSDIKGVGYFARDPKLAANYTIQIKVLIYTEIVELSFLFGSVTIPMTIENKNCTYSKSPEYFEHSNKRETWMGRVLRWEWRENKGSLSHEIRAACFYVKIGNFSYLSEGNYFALKDSRLSYFSLELNYFLRPKFSQITSLLTLALYLWFLPCEPLGFCLFEYPFCHNLFFINFF